MTVPALHPAAQALAQSLALAHIEQVRQRLLDPSADSLPARLLQQWIDQVGPLQVNQLADQASVEAVVRDYAFELDLGGGLVELLGLMARRIHQQLSGQPLRLGQWLSDRRAAEWLDKVLELQELREAIADQWLGQPDLQAALADWLGQYVLHRLPEWLPAWGRRHWPAERAEALLERLSLHLTRLLLSQLRQMLHQRDTLQDLGELCWQSLRDQPLMQAGRPDADDIEDFLVMVYELWRELRQQPLLQASVYEGVQLFFDTYGEQSVNTLLEDIGLSPLHLQRELRRFGPRLLQGLDAAGVLRDLIHTGIWGFYQSPEALQRISEALQAAAKPDAR